jgi:hypothetical protein
MPLHSDVSLTLPSLIKQRMKAKGISRPDLVSALGYKNISKGCRKLDNYLISLHAPSEEFVTCLLSILEINDLEFFKAVIYTQEKSDVNKKRSFQPYIEILLGLQTCPAVTSESVHNRCYLSVPQTLQSQQYKNEIDAVISLYQDHIENILHDSLKKNVIGFEYHRSNDFYLIFNADLVLKETISVMPKIQKSVTFCKKLSNLLSFGGSL